MSVPAPAASSLDYGQCIQGAYDSENGRLRVDAEVTATIGNVQTLPARISIHDFSQFISTGSQQLLGVNPLRSFLFIQNPSTDKVWIDFGQNAHVGFPSMMLGPGQTMIFENNTIPIDSISAIADTFNVPLIIKEGV